MDLKESIKLNLEHPRELELLYRRDPDMFKQVIQSLKSENEPSLLIEFWYERLFFSNSMEKSFPIDSKMMILYSILAGFTTRLLWWFVSSFGLAPINLIFGVLPFIGMLFIQQRRFDKKILWTLGFILFILIVYVNILPQDLRDSIILSYLHLPIILWFLLGISYTGNQFMESHARLGFLKFNGEVLVLYAIMALSGIVLTGVTLVLFEFIHFNVGSLYFENVVLVGASSLAVVATYLVTINIKLTQTIAPYIARIFSPLVLVTLTVYLGVILFSGLNPFLDRDFLLALNLVLILVLLIAVFSITEREKEDTINLFDYVNVSLIVLALLVDGIALFAIMFRLSSYGITPNRLVIFGINLIIFFHLAMILIPYFRFVSKRGTLIAIQEAVTRYLPVYGIWAIFITFIFPLIF